MKTTARGIAIRIAMIATVTAVAHMLSVRINAEQESSVIVNGINEYSYRGEGVGNEQKPKQETRRALDQWPMECEGAAARLDFAVIDTRKLEGTYLIVVARLGTDEISTRLNQIRLSVAGEYVLRRGSDLKYVLAQGSRVKGLGRLELYVGGRLKDILPFEKNAKGYCLPGRAN